MSKGGAVRLVSELIIKLVTLLITK
jgi:hypothetical protein